jgi:hypothetical protein
MADEQQLNFCEGELDEDVVTEKRFDLMAMLGLDEKLVSNQFPRFR